MALRPTTARGTTRTQSGAYDFNKYNAQDANEDATILDGHADDIETNATAITGKVDKVTGKGLSTNDYTTSEKSKVTNLPANATTELAAKANSSDVTTALAGKADVIDGIVPSEQLPSYIDEVQEYANLAAFPATGSASIIYIAIDSSISYRWGGTVYAALNSGVALGETSGTAYRGDRGKTAYDHSQVTHNKALVGLGNVDNTSDANKPVSTATQTALDLKLNISGAQAAIGLGNVENKSSATIRGEIVDANIPNTIARTADYATLIRSVRMPIDTTATGKKEAIICEDRDKTVTVVKAQAESVSTSIEIDIQVEGTTILSSPLTIAAGNRLSSGGIVPTGAWNVGEELTVWLDAGAGTNVRVYFETEEDGSVPILQQLAAPVIVSTTPANNQIAFTFTVDGLAELNEIEFKTGANAYASVTGYNGTDLGHTETGLSENTNYDVRIRSSASGYATSDWTYFSMTTTAAITYLVDDDFLLMQPWADPTVPDGYGKGGTHNATNKFTQDANGMRVQSDGTATQIQKEYGLTHNTTYNIETWVYSRASGAIQIQRFISPSTYQAAVTMDAAETKTTQASLGDRSSVVIARSSACDLVLRRVRIWAV